MRAKRSNLGFNEINALEIAASLTLLAMTTKNGFFRILLNLPGAIADCALNNVRFNAAPPSP